MIEGLLGKLATELHFLCLDTWHLQGFGLWGLGFREFILGLIPPYSSENHVLEVLVNGRLGKHFLRWGS